MDKLNKDINYAKQLIRNGKVDNEDSNYSKVYLNTTENIKDYMPLLAGDYKSALLPTSSGDHILEAVLDGVTDITCYDINPLSKYMAQLRVEAIKSLSKEDLENFFFRNPFNKEVFNYFKNNLDDTTKTFWEELINYYEGYGISSEITNLLHRVSITKEDDQVINGLKFYEYCLKNFTRYFNDDNYKIVQNNLQHTIIKYIDSDLLELAPKLEDNFDIINLTNIHEYINVEIFDDSSEKFANAVKELTNKLNLDGKMMINYSYEMGIKDYKKYKNKSMLYAHLLNVSMQAMKMYATMCLRHNSLALLFPTFENRQGAIDKLNEFREFQFLRYLKELDIEPYEIPQSHVTTNYKMKLDSDLVLIYKRK